MATPAVSAAQAAHRASATRAGPRPAGRAGPVYVTHRQCNPSRAVQEDREVVVDYPSSSSGGSSGDPAPASDAARRYLSLLPPFFSRATELEEFIPGQLWGLVQPFTIGLDIRLRMVVARLPDGSLLLVSPVAPTQEALSLLASLPGEVSHIVVPSTSPEHWLYGPALSDAFPGATVWAPPGFLEGKGLPIPFFQRMIAGMRPRCKVLGVDPLPAELQGQLESEVLAAPFFIEAALVLPQHDVLLLADTGFCMGAQEFSGISWANIEAAKKAGVWDRLGPITKIVFVWAPAKGREWVDAVLARPGWSTVVPAHATAPIRDGRAAFKDCFEFLYK